MQSTQDNDNQPEPILNIRWGWLIIAAFMFQLVAIYAVTSPDGLVAKKTLFGISAFILVLGILPNLRWWAIRLMAAGLLLNVIVMASNGGLMPISFENAQRFFSEERLAEYEFGQTLPRTKSILIQKSETRLYFMSDVIYSPVPVPSVYSIGDVLIFGGLVIFVIEASLKGVLRRKKNHSRLETSFNDRS